VAILVKHGKENYGNNKQNRFSQHHCLSSHSGEAIVANCCTPFTFTFKKGKASPYSIAESRVSELIPVLGSQSAGDVSHKPVGRLPLLSARLAVTLATLKRDAANFAAW